MQDFDQKDKNTMPCKNNQFVAPEKKSVVNYQVLKINIRMFCGCWLNPRRKRTSLVGSPVRERKKVKLKERKRSIAGCEECRRRGVVCGFVGDYRVRLVESLAPFAVL